MKNEIVSLIQEVNQVFAENGVDLMKEAAEILADDNQFNLLAESLCKGLEEDEEFNTEDFKQLAENSRIAFLEESNTSSNLNAFAPLQATLLRSIYPRLIARKAITTKTMTTPAEVFSWLDSYITANGTTVSTTEVDSTFLQGEVLNQTIDTTSPVMAADVFAGASVTRTPGATVDRNASLTALTVSVVDAGGANAETVVVNDTVAIGLDGNIAHSFKAAHSDGTTHDFMIIGVLDREAGTITLSAMASTAGTAVQSVDLVARTSFENNYTNIQIENKYRKDTIEVDDGEIINSRLPYSYLRDTKALFNVDAMAEAVDTLGLVFSQVTDLRVMNDLYDAVGTDASRTVAWDAQYVPGSGISRIDHNLELLERLNKAISISDAKTQFTGNVQFYVLANSVDAGLFASTNISRGLFSGDVAKGGVVRNYTAGAMTTPNGQAVILSSKLVRTGEVLVVPKSNNSNEVVFGLFEYSNVLLGSQQGYLNPENPRITNVSMLNRSTRKAFRTQGITKINIANSTL
jgi:hypothetical protein